MTHAIPIDLPPVTSYQPDAPASASEWENRRSTLRHDELKNRFLDRLDTFLDDDLNESNPELPWLLVFVEDDLVQWAQHSGEAEVLINTYASLLSPRTLLDDPPLSRMPESDKEWLANVMDTLWKHRHNIDQHVSQARSALQEANAAYQTLSSSLSTVDSVADLRQQRPTFESFRDAGYDLVDAFGHFCRKVRVT